ncbi:heavy metal translocating P-type ATPase metal-binding domain-containing protein [Verrucomicrobiales bacterium BCK34]|nr:heavy metal translocating P-type ATPase metal-binding domain-containing protein [Verrucomicrobiales bacterium BCK34]
MKNSLSQSESKARPAQASSEKRECTHCGNLFLPRFDEEKFCCSGCRVVHDLIQSGGLGSFYDLLGQKVLQPASVQSLGRDEEEELREAIQEAESNVTSNDTAAKLALRIGNLSCTACVWLIDHLFRQHSGALKINSDTTRSILTIWWNPGELDVVNFVQTLNQYGYPASLLTDEEFELPKESRSLLTRLGVTAGLAMNTMAFSLPSYLGLETSDELSRLFTLVSFASASLALAVGGSYFFQRALSALRAKTLHMDVPISLGLIAAFLGSLAGLIFDLEGMLYFDFVATFAFLMLGGRWMHLRLLERNRQQLWAREKNISSVIRITGSGERERVSVDRVKEGDTLELAHEGMLPVDAILASDSGSLQLDWITGEPEPVSFHEGSLVPAGARNSSNEPVRLIAEEAFAGTYLATLFDRASLDAADDGSVEQTNILKYYLLTVIAVAVAGFGFWLTKGEGGAKALQVLISVLIVSCPCALGLALPLLNEILLSKLKQKGIFIRRHSLWSRLKSIRFLDFDKTGTLTEPIKRLINPEAIDEIEKQGEDILNALVALTTRNTHPVGRALNDILLRRFGAKKLDQDAVVSALPGKGVELIDGGTQWRLGRDDWATGNQSSREQKGHCVFSKNGTAIARFELGESIRDGAKEELQSLESTGYRIRILSGDPDTTRVQSTASELGLAPDQVYSNLTPEEKATLIADNGSQNSLFIGDGGNDSLALAAAAASGTPATGIKAIESQADFVFTGRGFHAIGLLFEAAKRRRKLILAIFFTAILYNLIAVGICLAGHMNPLLAAILMPLSSIVTTAIAARV